MLSRMAMFGGRVASSNLIARPFTLSAKQAARFAGSRFTQYGFGTRTKAGPTLRERFLGPTTGKPFVYGTYAIAGASVFGIGMLCYYGAGMSKGLSAMDRASIWPEHVRQRLQATYAYLAGSLALSGGAAAAAARSPALLALTSGGGVLLFVGAMAAIVGTGMLVRGLDYERQRGAKLAAWAGHCAVLGALLAPLCLAGGPALLRAALYTAGLGAGLSATAMCAPSERFLMLGGPLAMGLGVVFVANVASFFLPPHTALGASLASVVVYGGLILFSGFLLYDTQRIIHQAERQPQAGLQTYYNEYGQPIQTMRQSGFDPINAQLSLYMDILNIFIRMVMVMGGGNQRRK